MQYCQNCGSSVEGNFCPSCGQGVNQQTTSIETQNTPAQYREPGSGPRSPPKLKGKRPLIIVLIVIIVVIGILAISLLGSSTVQMTSDEWQNEYDGYLDSSGDFPSLDGGDTVEITGIITHLTYYIQRDYSILELDNLRFPIDFEGAIRDYYDVGDCITITLNIYEVSVEQTGELKIYEGIDERRILSSRNLPISVITKA